MDQLTEQMNTVAASAIAENIIRHHINFASNFGNEPLVLHLNHGNAPESLLPRLIGLHHPATQPLTAWEKNVLNTLRIHPQTEVISRTYPRRDGTTGFRYAQPVTLGEECLRCHQTTLLDRVPATRQSSTQPTTRSITIAPFNDPRLLGFVSVDIPSQVRINQLLLNRVFMLTAGMLAGTLAIVVFYLITTRLILGPVRVLQETAEKVSKGDLNIRSDINTGDEFQQLSETFNTMLANLNRNADQLRSINKSLDIKVGQLAESNVDTL